MPARRKRLIENAVKLMGRKHVAEALAVSETRLEAWLKGDEVVPPSKLSRLAKAAADFARRVRPD